MSADAKLACNRLPFQTDDSCSRGDVDITVFRDLPICLPINPTEPKGGVPQTDIPVIPITPPPCACVNIDMSGTGKVENRKKKDIEVKTEFKSVGDCCEGNYKANVKVNIPCIPFHLQGGKSSTSIEIEEDCTLETPSGHFNPGIESDSCTFKLKPKIKIRLPKAKNITFNPELVIKNDECIEKASGSVESNTVRTDCSVEFKPKIRINIPKIPKFHACSSGEVTFVQSGHELNGSGSLLLNTSSDSCGNTKSLCPSLRLKIPCPIETVKSKKLKYKKKVKWGSDSYSSSLIWASSCSLKVKDIAFQMNIPCPIQKLKNKHPFKIRKRVKWGEWSDPIVSSSLAWYEESCSLKVRQSTAAFELDIPCPLQANDDNSIVKIKPDIGLCDCNCINFKPIDSGAKCCCDCKNYNGAIPCHQGGTCCDCTNFEAADPGYGRNCICGEEESITLLEKDPKNCKLILKKDAIHIPARIPFTNASVVKFIGTTFIGANCAGDESGVARSRVRLVSAPDSNIRFGVKEVTEIVGGKSVKTLNLEFGVYYV